MTRQAGALTATDAVGDLADRWPNIYLTYRQDFHFRADLHGGDRVLGI